MNARWLVLLLLVGCRSPGAEADARCPSGTRLVNGPGDEHEARAEFCVGPDGTRNGKYIGYWKDGAKSVEGEIRDGKREGKWQSFYQHGEVVSEGPYVDGKPHGVWLAFSLHRTFAFATCLEHGEKRWQLTSHEITEAEAIAKACP
jgi:hypothetical protein